MVHRVYGGDLPMIRFQEVIYQRHLAIEMQSQGLIFEREKSQPIYYTGTRRHPPR